jgi:hypothetical protein
MSVRLLAEVELKSSCARQHSFLLLLYSRASSNPSFVTSPGLTAERSQGFKAARSCTSLRPSVSALIITSFMAKNKRPAILTRMKYIGDIVTSAPTLSFTCTNAANDRPRTDESSFVLRATYAAIDRRQAALESTSVTSVSACAPASTWRISTRRRHVTTYGATDTSSQWNTCWKLLRVSPFRD